MARSSYVYVVRRKHSGGSLEEELEVFGTFTVKKEAHCAVAGLPANRLQYLELVRYQDGRFSEPVILQWDMQLLGRG